MEVSGRRRPTLLQHIDSSNLRDLLKAREDPDDGRNTLAGLTLAAVLSGENHRAPTRTLLDIIREEESGAAYRGLVSLHHHNHQSKKSWKSFKDRLRRRDGSAWPSSSSSSASVHDTEIQISGPISAARTTRNSVLIAPGDTTPVVIPSENVSDVNTTSSIVADFHPATSPSPARTTEPVLMRLSEALEAEREEQRQAQASDSAPALVPAPVPTAIPAPVPTAIPAPMPEEIDGENGNALPSTTGEGPRVSLMSLLELMDRQIEVVGFAEEERENAKGEDDVAEGGQERREEGRGQEYVCCVCMVRLKGAAFIPCGHTFCRLCSRELWASRGNCPLCNGYILEILDIF